ncbi:hypothetical protein M8J77_001510 [Diaphorina citri]|nr:hypothetical protein M8J77_001510 [Diaphorina citri]
MRRHIRRHTGEKAFHCPHCEYRCSQQSALYNHLKRHTGEKPFKCTICSHKAARKDHMKRHLQLKHNADLSSMIKLPKDNYLDVISFLYLDQNNPES